MIAQKPDLDLAARLAKVISTAPFHRFDPKDLKKRSLVERLTLMLGARGLHDVLSPAERAVLPYSYESLARTSERLPDHPYPKKSPAFGRWSGQMEPPGRWIYWIALAGRGFGKSFMLSHFVIRRAKRFSGARIAVVARTAGSLWGEVVEGPAGLLACSPKWFSPKVLANKKRLTFPNGSVVKLFSGEEPDTLRGPNHDFAAVDEFAAMPYAVEVWRQLQMTMRRGAHPQTMVATTPRPMKLLIDLAVDRRSAVTVGNSYDNRANVAQSWLEQNVKPYQGTAFGRQEVDGEIIEEMPGALFKRAWFDLEYAAKKNGWPYSNGSPIRIPESRFRRIGIGVDPAETAGEKADYWGIIAAALREDGLIEVLEDASVNDVPGVAARAAVGLYNKYGASFMKADVGRSGTLVKSIIKEVDSSVRVLEKGGNKGKRAWAESVSVLYENGTVFSRPGLTELEDQCCTWTDDVKWSPDRMDALAYVVTELHTPRPDQSKLGTKAGWQRRM